MKAIVAQTEQELKDAYYVRRTVFVEEQNVPEELEVDQYEQDCAHIVLYDDQSRPVGAGRYRPFADYGKVERVCILKSSRKGGAGKLVMDKMEEHAISQKAPALKLNSQTHAIPFYEKLGYEIVSEEFMDAGIPHRTMMKRL
ncbi:GNAT family N-acetyltransferase [Bacillus sp. B1-b2]|uniref:GNAT family N-acetyltransferase n=1 Tax=Bacillus sp. B1-b2 TaxID=2653201 RepID=UPI0012626BCD|nr:GNAT family N-acetyltransferase [Bacillus sp. B1-b2]KAB7667586.1 GNAT family N-acetyltransferase [Bacillus sp. B1-b2]